MLISDLNPGDFFSWQDRRYLRLPQDKRLDNNHPRSILRLSYPRELTKFYYDVHVDPKFVTLCFDKTQTTSFKSLKPGDLFICNRVYFKISEALAFDFVNKVVVEFDAPKVWRVL